jgi:hypothetical protein
MKLWSWGDLDQGDGVCIDIPADTFSPQVTITPILGDPLELSFRDAKALYDQLGQMITWVGTTNTPKEKQA